MTLPESIGHGTVTGIFSRVGADGSDDDLRPDTSPLAELQITFTPDLRLPAVVTTQRTETEAPQTFLVEPVIAYTDGNGRLVGPDGEIGIRLIAGGDPDLKPYGWSWRVTYGSPIPVSFSFLLMPDQIVDLSEVVRIPGNVGVDLISWQQTKQEAIEAAELAKLYRDEIIASGGGATIGTTVDTGELYKIIMYSNGNTRAVPFGTLPPSAPFNLQVVARASSATLTWAANPGMTFIVYRNGTEIGRTTSNTYRDAGTPGATYTYTVRAQNQYEMKSNLSAPAIAYLNPGLNMAPVVTVHTWPPVIGTTGKTIVRVNARDTDAQTLALSLGVSAGSLEPTFDPSVWLLTL